MINVSTGAFRESLERQDRDVQSGVETKGIRPVGVENEVKRRRPSTVRSGKLGK